MERSLFNKIRWMTVTYESSNVFKSSRWSSRCTNQATFPKVTQASHSQWTRDLMDHSKSFTTHNPTASRNRKLRCSHSRFCRAYAHRLPSKVSRAHSLRLKLKTDSDSILKPTHCNLVGRKRLQDSSSNPAQWLVPNSFKQLMESHKFNYLTNK